MELLLLFQEFIKKEKLFTRNNRLLLAVSGGLDSSVLCELCQEANLDFAIAHANFQLRGDESDRDEAFVKTLGEKYGRLVLTRKFDTRKYVSEKKVSTQVAARELRYAWFYEILEGRVPDETGKPVTPLDYLLTAHHLDDNIETLLMHFFRGSGISGLRGMLPRQHRIIRPLLFATREELLSYASAKGLSWVEDSTNEEDKYSRNYFRHQVIPLVTRIFPEAKANLAANLARFRDIELLYHQSVERYKKKLLFKKGSEWHIPVQYLKQCEPLRTILYEIIREFGFTAGQIGDVLELLDGESGKFIQSQNYRIIKNRKWLIIAPRNTEEADTILLEEGRGRINCPAFSLELSVTEASASAFSANPAHAQVDAADIRFPLLLRKWKQGDYFYPLGMQKKKKIARFLIDNKVSLAAKEKTWVIENDKKIVWVVGMRIDERFKVTASTRQVLNIEMRIT